MLIFTNPLATEHDPGPGRVERPEREVACVAGLRAARVVAEFADASPASRQQLERVHNSSFLDWLEQFCAAGGGWIDSDTFAGQRSFEASAFASGACCRAVEMAVERGTSSVSMVRPPGHHAGPKYAMGFCLTNHAAVGAAHALAMGVEKVAIIDFDVHHGNGTQDIFWREPNVLYISLHQFPWYPGTGRLEETGETPGAGTTVNLPLPARSGDATYLSAVDRIVLPVSRLFHPELIILSAGFDAHAQDPLSLTEVSTPAFGLIVARLADLAGEICDGRLVMTLEGGYNLEALAASFAAAVTSLEDPSRAAARFDEGVGATSAIDPAVERALSFHGRRLGIA